MSAISSRHVCNVHARPDIAIGAPLIHCHRHSVCSRSVEGRIDHAAQGNGAGCRPVLVEAPAPSAQSMPSSTRHVCVDPPEPPSSSPSRISRDVHAKPALLCNCQGVYCLTPPAGPIQNTSVIRVSKPAWFRGGSKYQHFSLRRLWLGLLVAFRGRCRPQMPRESIADCRHRHYCSIRQNGAQFPKSEVNYRNEGSIPDRSPGSPGRVMTLS